jgi:hypothetical protein
MKSSFLLTIALTTLLASSAWAQGSRTRAMRGATTKPKTTKTTKPQAAKPAAKPQAAKPVTTATSTQAVSATDAAKKTSFEKFYDRLSINYFGQFTSPTLEDWNQSNAALSPVMGDTERRCRKNCDTYAMNVWSQVNFAYDFGWKMKFNIIPRWTTYLANPRDMNKGVGEDRAMIGLEDFLVGISGVVVTTEDKKFNWWIRPGFRLPTSHFSRHYNNGSFGDLTNNLEIAHSLTYDFNPAFQVGMNAQQRMWVYEDRYNGSRLRLYFAPYISYSISDKTKWQTYYQLMSENNKRWEAVNNKPPVFKDVYQDMFTGIAHDFTDRLNVMPYIGVFVDDIPLSMRSAYLGAWISYRIK